MDFARLSGERGAGGPLAVAALVTCVATGLSYGLPEAHAATGVGLWFLAAVFVLVLRRGDSETIRRMGLSLGGLFEPETPIDPKRLLRAAARATGVGLLLAALVLPPFWIGYVLWYRPSVGFVAAAPPSLQNDVLGQLLGVAFPEEAFFRGYLQSSLDGAWPPRHKFAGARLGLSVVVTSAIFALGHFLTEPHPARLAVFFPSLVFGFVRAREGGVGAAIVFHAACNLFASYLGQSYGLF
ncbi:MAG: MrtC family glutamic-type intramembrane protease [Polyangiaceae bacterium]